MIRTRSPTAICSIATTPTIQQQTSDVESWIFGGIGEPLKVRLRAYVMTARSAALPDGLFRDDVLRAVRYCEGYVDLLGPG